MARDQKVDQRPDGAPDRAEDSLNFRQFPARGLLFTAGIIYAFTNERPLPLGLVLRPPVR